jgi:glycosyltransferase involved in cell wall biosynthesis
MKVILVGPVYPYRGGIAHYNASLAQSLVDAGHDVRLLSFRRQYPYRLYPGKSDKDPSVEPLSFPAEYILDPLFPWMWLYASSYIQKYQPDLVIFHWWTTFWAPAFTCLAWLIRRKTKVIFLIHNVLPHEAKAWDRWLVRTTFRQGQTFIVQAPHEHEKLSSLIPTSSQVIETHHPAYLPFGKQRGSKEEARQKLDLPADKPILLFFGIVRPYKGLKFLVDALAHVQQPVHLVIAGEFWEDINVYLRQIETLDLSEKISLINRYIPNEEAHMLFSAADGLVAPYVGGTQSGAASLALGYGLPIIMTTRVAAGLSKEVPNPQTGNQSVQAIGYTQVVPPEDSAALARAIDNLVTRLPTLTPNPINVSEDWSGLVKVIEQIGQARG